MPEDARTIPHGELLEQIASATISRYHNLLPFIRDMDAPFKDFNNS